MAEKTAKTAKHEDKSGGIWQKMFNALNPSTKQIETMFSALKDADLRHMVYSTPIWSEMAGKELLARFPGVETFCFLIVNSESKSVKVDAIQSLIMSKKFKASKHPASIQEAVRLFRLDNSGKHLT